ncbi:Ornithine decarboxylase antizyme domain containing protein [Naviculisporaceae sp. PSN 640]
MAPMKQNNHSSSNNRYGEEVAASAAHRQANILASCYLGPSGIPEVPSTGLPSPPSSPPLAAITSTNQLALTPKTSSRSGGRSAVDNHNRQLRRGGAALRIREECERFFCETLRALFHGERNMAMQHSGLAGAYHNNTNTNNSNRSNSFSSSDDGTMDLDDELSSNGSSSSVSSTSSFADSHGQLTPPDDYASPIADKTLMASYGVGVNTKQPGRFAGSGCLHEVTDWLEIWDYAGGASFRAFVTEDLVSSSTGRGSDTKSLFVFFDAHVGKELKKALVALIELADGPLSCSHMVICIDRSIPAEEAKALTKGLQWAGFSPTTLDFWSGGMDVTSKKWFFMGMEL